MKNTTTVFDQAAGRRQRKPRFSLTFTRVELNGLTLISWRDDATPERWPLIEKVSSQSGSIKPNEGSAEVSGMSVSILDDERFHQVAPWIYREDQVQLRGGYEGVLESDWPVLFTGLVADLQLDATLGVWELSLNGLNFYKIASAFRSFGKTHLRGAINSIVTSIPVDSTGPGTLVAGDLDFKNPAVSPSPCNGWLMIDDEIIRYTSTTGLTFNGCSRGQLQQCGGSIGAAHSDKAEVKELFVLEGNPVDLVLSILTTTGGGFNGAYDLWDSDQGLGIPIAKVDIAEFELQRNRFTLIPYRFVLKEGVKDVKKFIEEQICKTINAYPLVTGAGQLSIHIYSAPFGQVLTIEDDTINEIVNWKRGLGEIINYIIFKYDKSVSDDNYHSIEYWLDASAGVNGLSKSFTIEMDGIWTDLGAPNFCARRAVKIFQRYAKGAVSFGARVSFDKFKVDPADIIAVTHARLPDIGRGVRGVAHEWMEVISTKPDLMRGEVELEITDTHMDEGKAGVITPDNFLDYMSETDEHRKWGFICDTFTHLMPNGDPPSLIIG